VLFIAYEARPVLLMLIALHCIVSTDPIGPKTVILKVGPATLHPASSRGRPGQISLAHDGDTRPGRPRVRGRGNAKEPDT
jgi:hypothetical protein